MISFQIQFGIVLIIFSGVTYSMLSKKALEGYTAGYFSDCPNKTIPIRRQDLSHLALVVHGAGSLKRTKYNYFQSHLIAKDNTLNWSKKTVIYVGGYFDSTSFPHVRVVEAIYLSLGYNVILVEAQFFVSEEYPIVARKIRTVAHHVAEMLAVLHSSGVLNTSKVEMVGISLGAHTMGYIAKSFHQLTGKKMSRVTGLDPSGPCFRNLGPEDRLAETDGEFVQIIHTNIDFLGMAVPMGHIDFYVNGGEYQILPGIVFCDNVCSHVKAYFIWLAALIFHDQNSFVGIKCESVQQARFRQCYGNRPLVTNVLGLKTDPRKRGIFYLSTSSVFPYFLGEKGLKKDNDNVRLLMKSIFRKN